MKSTLPACWENQDKFLCRWNIHWPHLLYGCLIIWILLSGFCYYLHDSVPFRTPEAAIAMFAAHFSKRRHTMIDSGPRCCSDNLNSSILTQSNGFLMDVSNLPHRNFASIFATCGHCVRQVNVDNQHVDATNILILGSERDWVDFGCRAWTTGQIEASFCFKESPCRRTSERQTSACEHERREAVEKMFFPSAYKRMSHATSDCATISLSFSWNAEVCSSCVLRWRCKVRITCCHVFIFLLPIKKVVESLAGWQISGNTFPLLVKDNPALFHWRSRVCLFGSPRWARVFVFSAQFFIFICAGVPQRAVGLWRMMPSGVVGADAASPAAVAEMANGWKWIKNSIRRAGTCAKKTRSGNAGSLCISSPKS